MQSFSTEAGDTFVGLVRRVYDIHEHERVCQIAAIVAGMTPRNVATLKHRIHAALAAGLVLDFPAWQKVGEALAVVDRNRTAALAHVTAKKAGPSGLVAPRAAVIKRPDDLLAATGERAETLSALLVQESEHARIGEAIGRRAPLDAIAPAKLEASLSHLLRTVAPKSFATSTPNVGALAAGVQRGLSARLDDACKAEFSRRWQQVQNAVASGLPLEGTSAALPGDALTTLREATIESAVTPKIRTAIAKTWQREDLAACAPVSGVASFIDAFDERHEDGTLAAQIFAFSAGGEAQQTALARAAELLSLVTVGVKGSPSADVGACLGDLLRVLRTRRASQPAAEQARELAEERRLLAGRNYTTYRKDVNAAIDTRLQMSALDDARRRVVYFAFLCSTGHRLSGMAKDQIDEALEKLIK